MEDRLTEFLEQQNVSCLLLGRLTHGGVRELVFQVSEWTPFRPPVGRWMQLHPDYETDVSEHDGWDFFFSSVWPSAQSWLLIQDRRVVDQLIKSGSDPQKPHSLEYVFRGAPAQLQAMRNLLTSRGYTLVESQPDESRLVMAKSFTLDLDPIYEESIRHQEDCRRLEIEYEGWGCLVVS
jgi:hypothetical protein